jgi:glycosyltransferase involved in cell wall biosynthesis
MENALSDFRKIFDHVDRNDPEESIRNISHDLERIKEDKGIQASYNDLLRLEVALGIRKPSVAVYDNALHFIGGAQKYGCTIAQSLQEICDVTLISHKKVTLIQLQDWYGLDLDKCRTKVIKIPFFEARKKEKSTFDAGEVDLKGENPFHVVSMESGEYDIFINNCMLEMVYPLSNISEFVCHFPERERSRFFHADKYSHIICNSRYTGEWVSRIWDLKPHKILYPPVDMMDSRELRNKEKIILSVSRFELSGKKQQLEMIRIFERMLQRHPEKTKGWKMVIAGGSVNGNPYLERVRKASQLLPEGKIDLRVDISLDELRELYRKASIFWHLAGLEQRDPERAEHFGMTTVEAMQNRCAPVVYRGGGQKEIIEAGVSGLFFDTRDGLVNRTLELMDSVSLREKIGRGAFERGKGFTKKSFLHKAQKHFEEILKGYCSVR